MRQRLDEGKFRSAYESHARALLGYALRRTATPADAADAVAETMLTAWRRIDIVPDEPETVLWLYGVARKPFTAPPPPGESASRLDPPPTIEWTHCELFRWADEAPQRLLGVVCVRAVAELHDGFNQSKTPACPQR